MDIGIKFPDENLSIDEVEAWFKNLPRSQQFAVWSQYLDRMQSIHEASGTQEYSEMLNRYGGDGVRKANQRVIRYYKYIDPKGYAEHTAQFDT